MANIAAQVDIKRPIFDQGFEVGILLRRLLKNVSRNGISQNVTSFVEDILTTWQLEHQDSVDLLPLREIASCLSSREQRILELIAQGHSNKEAARDLGISAETVKSHVKHIFSKLEVNRRAQAIFRGQTLGLLPVK